MPWYLYIALKQLFPTGKRFPFFTAISILGVALGVAVLVVTTGVMAGFGEQIRRMMVDTQGDVQILSTAQSALGTTAPVERADEILALVEKAPGVEAAAPFTQGLTLFEFDQKQAMPVLHGIDMEKVDAVVPIRKYVLPASAVEDLDDDSVILSRKLAEAIGAGIGSRVNVYSLAFLQKLIGGADGAVLPREMTVTGLFEIGHQHMDTTVAIVTLRSMQDLYGIGSAVHGLHVKLAPGLDADEAAAALNRSLPVELNVRAVSWMETNQDFLFVLQMEKNMISFLLTFIIVVAAFSVSSSLLISVVRKTREIGLLGALGGTPAQIAACFCFQGFIIGLAGTGAGLGLGYVALRGRNAVLEQFTKLTESEELLARFYQFSSLPAQTRLNDLLLIIVCSVVISTIAGLLPAWKAAKLKPVEALRNE